MNLSDEVKQTGDDKMHFTDVYVGVVKLVIYRLFRLVFNLIRGIFWILNGTLLDQWKANDPENYDRSAQIYDIVYRYKFDLVLGQASFEDFVLIHPRFVHPMYLLRDECLLYQVTPTHAIFVQVDDGVAIWRSEHGSFLRQSQFQLAKNVITLPLHAVVRLADELRPLDEEKLIFIQNTARCGSTLLVRMFELTGRCMSLSEPDAINGICKLAKARRTWDAETSQRLVRAIVRLLCKSDSSLPRNPLAYVLKMTAPSIEAAPFLAAAFPEAYHLFMYRDCISMAKSLAIAAEVMPTLKLVSLLGSISAKGLQFAVSQMGCSNTEYTMKLTGHPYETGIVLYSITVRNYLKMLEQGIPIAGVRYEDLADDPEYFIEKILKYCQLPVDLSTAALMALRDDAQRNSPLSISSLKSKNKNYSMTPKVAEIMDRYLQEIGVPTEEAPVLPNTITHRAGYDDSQVPDQGSGREHREESASITTDKQSTSARSEDGKEGKPTSQAGGVRKVKLITTLKTTKTRNDVIVTTSRIPKNNGVLSRETPMTDPEESKAPPGADDQKSFSHDTGDSEVPSIHNLVDF
ncbi:hypothetical protein LSH36_770g01020 [Paralvinella palmiformis]|uniref:Uncharacterized protein n=1 Tax=Paralvinella palmiformis TaxID=53620 RepID=A0AAD9MSY8_9ANNE|nr:hypothetical protein LSH36_770g01020 [Paralvinella palmiformis]